MTRKTEELFIAGRLVLPYRGEMLVLITDEEYLAHRHEPWSNYARHTITVKSANGELLAATTYRVIHPRAGVRTNVEYVGYIVPGLREHGVAAQYIAKVKAIAIANNPTIAAAVNAL